MGPSHESEAVTSVLVQGTQNLWRRFFSQKISICALTHSRIKGVSLIAHKLKRRLGPLWWHAFLMFMVGRVGDVVGLYIALILVPDHLPGDKLGDVLPLVRMTLLIGVPLAVVGRTAMKFIGVFLVGGEDGKVKQLLRDLSVVMVGIAVATMGCLALVWTYIQDCLKVDDDAILWLVGATAVVSCLEPVATMAAQGLKKFHRLILAKLASPIVRLVVVVVLIERLQVAGYLAGNFVAISTILLILSGCIRGFLKKNVIAESYRSHIPEMLRYMVPTALIVTPVAFQQTFEPFVIASRLPNVDSAGYYIAAMFGNIPLWVAPAMLPFLFPLVSERFEKGLSTAKMYVQSVVVIAGIGSVVTVLCAFGGEYVLGLRETWAEYIEYAPYMWKISVITTITVLLNCHMMHESACRRFGYLFFFCPLVFVEMMVFFMSPLLAGAMVGMPAQAVAVVGRLANPDLALIVGVMLSVRLLSLFGVCVSWVARSVAMRRNYENGPYEAVSET